MPVEFIHRFEPGPDSASPLLLLLHGTGGDENDLIGLAGALRPGAPLLAPRGQVLENGMPRYFRRLAEGVFDQEDLRLRTEDLAEFVRDSREEYGLAGRPVIAVGFSNGANIAASMLLRHPDVLSGAVLLRAMVPFEPEAVGGLDGVPVLMAQGRHDPLVPVENAERLAALLRRAGADVLVHWADTGHRLTEGDVEAARVWLASR